MAIVRLVGEVEPRIPKRLAEQLFETGAAIGADAARAARAVSSEAAMRNLKSARRGCLEMPYWLRLLAEVYPPIQESLPPFYSELQRLEELLTAAYLRVRHEAQQH